MNKSLTSQKTLGRADNNIADIKLVPENEAVVNIRDRFGQATLHCAAEHGPPGGGVAAVENGVVVDAKMTWIYSTGPGRQGVARQ